MSISKRILQRLTSTAKESPKVGFPHVNVYYWRRTQPEQNFGDHLSEVVVTKILANKGHVLAEETKASHTLFAIGSILHFARDGDVVWGSGVNGKHMAPHSHPYRNLDVRAVRGPLTRDFLQAKGINVPAIYGDPALLIPELFPGRFRVNPRVKTAIVPNLFDMSLIKNSGAQDVISPLESWNKCVTKILEAELVISSSLHGIIIAEAYGIPARYVRLTETEPIFKYDDYTTGTGRGRIVAARSIAEAVEMGGMDKPVIDKHKLLNAFPIDLWTGAEEY